MLHKPIKKAWLLYVCLLSMFAGCSKCNKTVEPDKAPTASLPPATQTGAGTFGCMVNGQPWLPVRQGIPLEMSNPSLGYDATFEGGTLTLGGSIYINRKFSEMVSMGGRGIGAVGEYNLTNSGVRFFFANESEEYISNENGYISTGKLVITKLDKTNNIIAGTFSFTIEKKDTGNKVTVTDGRFDMKYL